MAVPTAHRRSRLWLAIRLGLAVALLVWFGRYAYLRLTVMPPRTADNLYEGLCEQRPAEPGDATEELSAVVAVLNQPATFVRPNPPAGYEWSDPRAGAWLAYGRGPWFTPRTAQTTLDVGDAINGEWTPAMRPHLQAVITWLTSQATDDQLDKLRRLRGRPYRFDVWASYPQPYPRLSATAVLQLARDLAADARYQHAERGDLPGAWEDLKTGLWIGEGLPPDALSSLLAKLACQMYCLDELQHMTLEHELSAELAADMDRTVGDLVPALEGWRPAITGEGRFWQAIVDACFTRDADGNGWLVLSAEARVFSGLPGYSGAGGSEARIWNLASIFYNDRATVEGKVRNSIAATIAAGGLEYTDAVHALDTSARYDWSINRLDGHRLLGSGFYATRLYQLVVRHEAARRATRLMVALNRFKAERGQYPERLSELAPTYIAELPPDPFGAPSFGYRREAPDRYTLYSLGVDGKDDGGVAGHTDQGTPKRFSDHGDDIYTWPRAEPTCEPTLVPVQPPAGTNAPGGTPQSGDATEGAGDE